MQETPATKASVVEHYADLAHAGYEDALITARALDEATDRMLANPTEANLQAAREAWLDARVPYQQTEVFRFGNAIVDDWEGQLNAWPLDEGLIDYVQADDYQYELGNAGATANIIASERVNIGGETIDVSNLTPELLAGLNEAGGSEANVATGYHAIEFLLWGQDLHGFEQGSGERPGERMKVALVADLEALEDPHDEDGDGISGRLNQVWDLEAEKTVPGRFGWKAAEPSVHQQSMGAFAGDMGLTSSLKSTTDCTPEQNCGQFPEGGQPEVSDKIANFVTFYAKSLAVPARRDMNDASIQKGARLFNETGCAACHTPRLGVLCFQPQDRGAEISH